LKEVQNRDRSFLEHNETRNFPKSCWYKNQFFSVPKNLTANFLKALPKAHFEQGEAICLTMKYFFTVGNVH
jgi:hypothetical protein